MGVANLEPHLTDLQIDALLRSEREHIDDPALDRDERESARVHLESCNDCLAHFREQESAMERLDRLKLGVSTSPGAECPSDRVWIEIAAGVEHQQTELYLSHAIQCDFCGPLLRQAAADLADEIGSVEQAYISSLPSASRSGQRRLASILNGPLRGEAASAAGRFQSWLQTWFSPQRLAYALLIMAIVAGTGWLAFRWIRAHSPEVLIAEAYQERRTLEMRIEGAPYAPLHLERGDSSNRERMARPALLNAEAEIAHHLKSNSEDVRWLQASGRANLLENDPAAVEQALSVLLKARALAPDNLSVTIDTASAYLLRGEIEKREEDIAEADNLLGTVLAAKPDDEVALFNEALTQEALGLNQKAIETWRKFLQSQVDPQWAIEAQRHLDILQAKIHSYRQRYSEPLLSVEEVAAAFEGRRDLEIEKIDNRIEEYQNVAIRQWLPHVF